MDRVELLLRRTRDEVRLGNYRKAARLARVGIAFARLLTRTHPLMPALLNELGMIGKYTGRFTEAERYYRKALTICESLGARAEIATILHNSAGLAHAQGNFRVAESLASQGIRLRETLRETDWRALTADYAALAAIQIDLDKLKEASQSLEYILAEYEAKLGQDHAEIAYTLHNIGSFQYRAGAVDAANRTLERCYFMKVKALGPSHPDLAITLHNWACCLNHLGDTSSARARLLEAVEILTGLVSNDQPTLASCREKLGDLTRQHSGDLPLEGTLY